MFGRFVPDFGRVVAQMQFDMYHHYTVDEHSIRAIGLLAAIERGELKNDHPLSTAIFRADRFAAGALCRGAAPRHRQGPRRRPQRDRRRDRAPSSRPRFGLDPAETETVSWLVRHHLLLSSTAFKRDLADPKTIEDFVRQVQSPERLRLLLILTVVDIRAVGPGVWNEWKRTLLRTLFEAAEERLRLGHKQHGRSELVDARQKELAAAARLESERRSAPMRKRLPDSYWLAEPLAWQVANARQVADGRSAYRRCDSRASSPRTTATAERPGSASSRPTARACSTASAPGSPRPAPTSSTRGSTPRATAWRSTICWS